LRRRVIILEIELHMDLRQLKTASALLQNQYGGWF